MMEDSQTTWQTIWGNAKKTAKFIWRHFFTLFDISLSIKVLIFGSLIWKNALISLCVAITIDWVKQFIKFMPNPRVHHFHSDSHAVSRNTLTVSRNTLNDQWSNPNVMGTPAYLMRNSHYR